MAYQAVVIGVSAGGMKALSQILPELPGAFPWPVLIAQHLREDADSYLASHLDQHSALRVKEAEDKEAIRSGVIYIAPPGYHLLVEETQSFALSAEPPVNFARPSIDVLFTSAVEVYEEKLIGVVLTGANSDGAQGLAAIEAAGGMALVQSPESAEAPVMPHAALAACKHPKVLALEAIAPFLTELACSAQSV